MSHQQLPTPGKYDIPPIPTVPWTPGDVGWGLLIFVLWILVFGTLALLGERLGLLVDAGVLVIFGEAILLTPVWYFTVRKYKVSWADLGLRDFRPAIIGLGCGLMVLSALFNFLYASLLAVFNLRVQPDIGMMFENTNFPLLLLFGGAIIAPVVEEIFFRGFVFTGLSHRWSPQKAALASAGLFALAHFAPTSVLPIFILGLIFAFLYQISGSIWPAILMHMLTNTLALSAAYGISQGWIPSP